MVAASPGEVARPRATVLGCQAVRRARLRLDMGVGPFGWGVSESSAAEGRRCAYPLLALHGVQGLTSVPRKVSSQIRSSGVLPLSGSGCVFGDRGQQPGEVFGARTTGLQMGSDPRIAVRSSCVGRNHLDVDVKQLHRSI